MREVVKKRLGKRDMSGPVVPAAADRSDQADDRWLILRFAQNTLQFREIEAMLGLHRLDERAHVRAGQILRAPVGGGVCRQEQRRPPRPHPVAAALLFSRIGSACAICLAAVRVGQRARSRK